MSRVIVHRATYNLAVVREKIFAILDDLGARQRIGKNTRVLIKPNLLAPAKPERAMLTHPAVVRATAEYAMERGAVVQISDSPALGSLQKVLQQSGIQQALEGLDVRLEPFKASLAIAVGEPFNRLEIAADAVNAEVLINLPKLKTHSQMLLTLGV